MMFIVRTSGERPNDPGVRIAAVRATPALSSEAAGQIDLFIIGDDDAPERLRSQGWQVVLLRDGWYQDDGEDNGGIAIWGQGTYWEVRDTPFSIREASGPAGDTVGSGEAGDNADIRRGIFGV
jgi:hypothetical protein